MGHRWVEVAAYQETLLIMAVFGIAILAMLWVGFRRWLQYKEKIGRLHIEQVDARLRAIEQLVGAGRVQTLHAEPVLKSDEVRPDL